MKFCFVRSHVMEAEGNRVRSYYPRALKVEEGPGARNVSSAAAEAGKGKARILR